jgi:CRISPR-associated Cas5-like protein
MTGTAALEVTVTAPVVSFRNPLYAGVQVGLPCPPPATVAGMLAAAAGGWDSVDPELQFAMAFRARGSGTDLETYHPLEASGRKADPTPRERDFLADITLIIWLLSDLDHWTRRLRRPVFPLRLGRSQDLIGLRCRRVSLDAEPGAQRAALVPRGESDQGTLLRLPTAVSLDRSRTRWDDYRYDASGRAGVITRTGWSAPDGQAVVPLPPAHPVHAMDGGRV